MNYDRLLTRVFDKQERVMIYPGDEFSIVDRKNFVYKFYGVTDEGLIVETNYYVPNVCGQSARYTAIIPFGDRFVPMQCTGLRDKNKKLIYDGDVIDCLGNNCKRTVALSDGCWVVKCTQGGYFEDRDYELSLWDSLDSKNDEIIGNIHENEGA